MYAKAAVVICTGAGINSKECNSEPYVRVWYNKKRHLK